jgi:F-type H+-transporting ATPase subunit a
MANTTTFGSVQAGGLFAEANATQVVTSVDSTVAKTESTAAGAPKEGGVFVELLDHLADSHELHFDPIGHVPLPYLFWDGDGFHFFGGEKSLVASGKYETGLHGKAIRKDEKPISFDMSITANVFFMALSSIILFLVVKAAANKAKKSLVPKGIRNLVEVLMIFIRDEVVLPAVEAKYAEPLMPFFLTIFFFILMLNLIGLLPYGHAATGAVSVTAALALCTFFVTQATGMRSMGVKGYVLHLTGGLHEMELPMALKIILILIMIPIEIMGLFTKPFALAIRLFANMTAGHIVIVSLIGLAFLFKSVLVGSFVSVPFALFINLLELLVAFLQAYIFTMLSALFIGMMVHEHAHEEAHGEAHVEHAH